MSVFHFYLWTIIASAIASAALALIGAQLASRNQSVQTMVVSQSSSLGVVIGLAFCLLEGHEELLHWMMPLFFGMAFSAVVYGVCNRGEHMSKPSRNTFYVGLFAVFASLTYLVTSLVPALEAHMSASYFGDVTLVSNSEAMSLALVALVALLFLLFYWREITAISFERTMFGQNPTTRCAFRQDLIFVLLSLLTIVLSIQFMGLLFSLSALFLPSLFFSSSTQPLRLNRLAIYLVIVAMVSSVAGFVLSLISGNLPTTPTMTLLFVIVGFVARKVSAR